MSSDEYDFDYVRFRMVMIAGVILVGSGIFCLFDLLFLVFGGRTIAIVSDVYQEPTRRGKRTITEWKFTTPSGEERTGKTAGSGVNKGDPIEIQYLPSWLLKSWDSSRPVKPFNWFLLSVFLASAAGTGFFGYTAIFQAETPQGPRRR